MENKPFTPRSFEAPNSGAEKPDKDTKKDKKKPSAPIGYEAPAADNKKEKAQRDLASSIDKLPLIERATAQPASDAKAEATAEKSNDKLSEAEVAYIQQETARDHLVAIEQADEATAESLQPATEFLQKVADGQDVETAFAMTAAEAGLDTEEIAALDTSPDELVPESTEIGPAADEDMDGIIDTLQEDAEGVVGWRSGSSSSRSGGSAGGRGTPPPPPPPISGGSAAAGSGGSGGSGGGSSRGSSSAAAAPTPANALPPKAEAYYQERNKAGELLLIGLVGYLIGRRRGRIRTEKKLLPLQRKLEKQVTQLQSDITHKERQLVAIKAARQPAESRPVVAPAERTQPGRSETRLGMEKPVRAERLGHMVVAAEAPRKTPERSTSERPDSPHQALRAEQVPDMSRNDLLELSEKIVVEGASLRRIYESRLIGEKQLRYLVGEYLQGKDIHKGLRREMVEHEIDFERDPILRDRVRSRMVASEGGGLGDMLAKAGITAKEVDPEFEHRVSREAARQAAAAQKDRRKRRVADVAMVTVIGLLAALVAVLVLGG